jgi:hypothetical protein
MGMVGTTLMPKAASMYDTDACALIVICTEEKKTYHHGGSMAQQTAFFLIFFLPPLLLPFAMNFKIHLVPTFLLFSLLIHLSSTSRFYHMVIECPIKSHRRGDKS